ncbi:MAG TPA: hypothetical protein VJ625_14500 [Propionibacteriaceae bacterium]|nr:hypothetical protein [Propionibacteriaceae bacterium]
MRNKVVVEESVVRVITVGIQGPPGTPGAGGASTDAITTAEPRLKVSLSGHEAARRQRTGATTISRPS